MPKKWFTSDKHHHHKNIIEFENRPFDNVKHMDESMIRQHNLIVSNDDICYDLGDFCFSTGAHMANLKPEIYLKQYNGRYVIIQGNHDSRNSVIDCITKATMRISGLHILCVHDPIYATNNYDLVLHGHLHSKLFMSEIIGQNKKTLLINVGVDCWKYRPVSWDKLFGLYQKWQAGHFTVPQFNRKKIQEQRMRRSN